MARPRHGGSRRKTQWAGLGSATGTAVLPEEVALGSGTAGILSINTIIGGAAGFLEEEVTITRMIGSLTLSINDNTALIDTTVAVGCAVARAEAVSAGVASLPSPEDDPDFEWLYYGVFGMKNPQNALRDGPASARTIQFDVRGQRVMRTGQTVVWIAEAQGADATAQVGGRYLVKLT